MSTLLTCQLLATSVYAGFQWTVRAVVYPQFRAVPATSFVAYEASHSRRTSLVVGPLFATLTVLAALLLLHRPSDVPIEAALAAAALLLVILGLTVFGAVPCHRALGARWDEAVYGRLLRVDSIRVAAATANVALAGYLALR